MSTHVPPEFVGTEQPASNFLGKTYPTELRRGNNVYRLDSDGQYVILRGVRTIPTNPLADLAHRPDVSNAELAVRLGEAYVKMNAPLPPPPADIAIPATERMTIRHDGHVTIPSRDGQCCIQ